MRESISWTGTVYAFISTMLVCCCCLSASADCIEDSNAEISLIADNGLTIDVEVDICVEVGSSPSPKTVTFSLDYDSNNDGVSDTNVSWTYDPPGSTKITAGWHCLSDFGETFFITLPHNSQATLGIGASTSASVGGTCGTVESDITINGDERVVLPVELIYFKGRSFEKGNHLGWATASQSEFSHFEVERSSYYEGGYRTVKILNSVAESAETLHFSYFDYDSAPTNYYRLKMVDLDGTFEYSPVIVLRSRNSDGPVISVFPSNISKGEVLHLELNEEFRGHLMWVDMNGRLLWTSQKLDMRRGNHTLEVPGLIEKAGMYMMIFQDENKELTPFKMSLMTGQ